MPAPLVTGAAQARRYAAGVAFLVVASLLVGLSIGVYTKAFSEVVWVTLQTDRIGNQLSVGGDVKLRGIVVGDVREVRSDGRGATIRLALDPDRTAQIPAGVSARLLPKTLFGEKEVALQAPAGLTGRAIRDGDVITQDRTEVGIETQQVLTDLLPLLQSLGPADLSVALNALSSALRGRGDRLGANLALNADYFRALNPSLPDLLRDFRGIADVSNSYADAAPDLLRMLDEFSAVARNTVDQRAELDAFLTSTTAFADEATGLLNDSERALIELAAESRPSLELYRRYAPGFPCMLSVLPEQELLGRETFGGRIPGLHITLESTRDQGPYLPQDTPVFADRRGPTCLGLTGEPIRPFQPTYEPKDGYCDEEEAASPGVTSGNCREPGQPGSARSGQDALATMLYGPLARGGQQRR